MVAKLRSRQRERERERVCLQGHTEQRRRQQGCESIQLQISDSKRVSAAASHSPTSLFLSGAVKPSLWNSCWLCTGLDTLFCSDEGYDSKRRNNGLTAYNRSDRMRPK